MLPDIYRLFKFEPLHNLHLRRSKIVKDTVITYLSSDTPLINPKHKPITQKPLIQVQKAMLGGCNACLTAIEKNGGCTIRREEFSRGYRPSEVSGLFTSTDLREVFEKMTIALFNSISSCGRFFYRATGLVEQANEEAAYYVLQLG